MQTSAITSVAHDAQRNLLLLSSKAAYDRSVFVF